MNHILVSERILKESSNQLFRCFRQSRPYTIASTFIFGLAIRGYIHDPVDKIIAQRTLKVDVIREAIFRHR